MALDPHYIAAFNIEDVLLDKDTGAPLAGGQVFFYDSLQPSNLKAVWQITGTDPDFTYIELPNPMILSSIGTFQDAMANPVIPYFLPYSGNAITGWGDIDYYRVVVLSAGDVPQFIRDPVPFVPQDNSDDVASAYVNEISNPQFAVVNFDTSAGAYTFNYMTAVNVVTNIAPNWDIIVNSASTATVTVQQITPAGDLNILTNPGTTLRISSTSLTNLTLRQRIYGSPNLWGSGFVSASFVAKTSSGVPTPVTMYYAQSNGNLLDDPVTLVAASLNADDSYHTYPESGSGIPIPASTSTQTYPGAYIDIYFQLPVSSMYIEITSVMLAATGAVQLDVDIDYDQESLYRQIDHLYHYAYPIVPIGTIIDFFGFNTPQHYTPCNYALLNRIQYNQLFNTITHVETVTLTSSSATFTVAAGALYSVGYGLEGVGIPVGTTITGISTNTITMSSAATASGTVPVRFFAAASIIQETVTWTGASAFGVANGALYHVGQAISGIQIPTGTTISTIVSNAITISAPSSPNYVDTNQSIVNFYDAGNGDGSTTFNVPDARRKNTVGAGGVVVSSPASAISGGLGVGNQVGNVGGQELHLQLLTELAQHNHTFSNIGGTGANGYGAGGFNPNVSQNVSMTPASANVPFNVIQPGLVTNKCIRFE